MGGHNTHRKLTSYSIENVPNFDHLGKLLKCQNFEKLALNCTSKYLLFIVGYHCLKMILLSLFYSTFFKYGYFFLNIWKGVLTFGLTTLYLNAKIAKIFSYKIS